MLIICISHDNMRDREIEMEGGRERERERWKGRGVRETLTAV